MLRVESGDGDCGRSVSRLRKEMQISRLERLFWCQGGKPILPERCADQVMVMDSWTDVALARNRSGDDIFVKVAA